MSRDGNVKSGFIGVSRRFWSSYVVFFMLNVSVVELYF